MSWKKLTASAVLIGTLIGCQSSGGDDADLGGHVGMPWKVPGTNPSTTSSNSSPDVPVVPRAQKPDVEPPKPVTPTLLTSTTDAGSGRMVSVILATVNGKPILESDVRSVAPPGSSPEDLRRALDRLIERELVLQDCEARFGSGPGAKFLEKLREAGSKEFDRQVLGRMKTQFKIKSDEELKALLKSQGITVDGLRKQWEKQFVFQQYLQFKVSPALETIGHDEMRDYYDSHPEEFQNADSVHWQDIFIAAGSHPDRQSARKAAEQVQARMKQGEDIAKLLPLDQGDSTFRNGDGLGRKRGEIKPPEAEGRLFSMKDKDTAIVELDGGFHVIRVVKREYAGLMPFDEDTQTKIRKKLTDEAYSRETKQFINELKRRAAVEIAR